ncbi:MAG: glycoside hydrolase family 16 protein [Planctomycetota bacterium]|nr:glycoside hydrolase family 16 protein [Planctomycetota bacterium]
MSIFLKLAFWSIFSLPIFAQERLIWSDEFNAPRGTRPDPSKWGYDLGGGGWGNRELQVYTDRAENARHDGKGHLQIRAVKGSGGTFTSARLKTKGKFEAKYIRVVSRLRVPKGQGLWPALWMLGNTFPQEEWPNCSEIDIMEYIGKTPDTTYGTVHGPGYAGKEALSGNYKLADGKSFGDGFHTYAVDWTPDRISYYVDNKPYHTVEPKHLPAGANWVFNRAAFLLLNLAVGGEWPGFPDDTTRFPGVFEIDWIRVYQKDLNIIRK